MNTIKELIKRLSIVRTLLRLGRAYLGKYAYNNYSQNGEDGIIDEILFRLRIKSGCVVEFGAADGMTYSNTYNILKNNQRFKAVYIECDPVKYSELAANLSDIKNRVILFKQFVDINGANSLDNTLDRADIGADFEVLSIDIDGADYHIWKSVNKYKPKVVVIEIYLDYGANDKIIQANNGPQYSSFAAMLELGREKGYTLICFTGNMIFVRNDLIPALNISKWYLDHQERLFGFYKGVKK